MALIRRTAPATGANGQRSHARDREGLLQELESENPVARRWAARDLVDHPSTSPALVQRLMCEHDVSVREVILTTLTSLGGAAAVTGLVACLRSENVALRNEAIEAMQQLPEAVGPIMDGLLGDADSDVRIFAINILESLRHPRVEEWLLRVIESDQHLNVCATAVDLLGEVGSAAAREPLEHLRARFPAEPYIQFAADLALTRIAEIAS